MKSTEAVSPALRRGQLVGGGLGLLTFLTYLVGLGRTYDYDASLTVATFIATPSVLDPVRRQIVFNNHPAFSLFEHVLYSAGIRGEFGLRLLPVAFAAAAVGVLAYVTYEKFGAIASVMAALVVATNPMFYELARQVRGYSLVVLAAVASTALLPTVLKPSRRVRFSEVLYLAFLGVGIGTHLYGGLVLILHATYAVASHRTSRRLAVLWAGALVLGACFYALTVKIIWKNHGNRGSFNATFPARTVRELLGHSWVAVVCLAILVGVAIFSRRLSSAAWITAGTGAVLIAIVWLVVRPTFLYPRFLVWLVPAVGFAVAVAINRQRILAVPAALAVVAMVATCSSTLWSDPIPSRQTVSIIHAAEAKGLSTCTTTYTGQGLAAYISPPRAVNSPEELSGCDVVIQIEGDKRTAATRITAAVKQYPYQWSYDGQQFDVNIYSRDPLTGHP